MVWSGPACDGAPEVIAKLFALGLLLAAAGCRDQAADFGQPDAEPALMDATTAPDATSGLDALSGVLDAASSQEPGPGDLVIVEVQGNPQNAGDDQAEFVELVNVSGRPLDLEGCRLLHRVWSGMGMAPVDSVGDHRVSRSVPVAPGARVLLARSNGGFFGGATRDYVYSGFELGNGGSDNNRLRLMAPSWDGVEPPDPDHLVDEVIAPLGAFDNDLRGRAWQLDPARAPMPSAAANDDATSWCHAPNAAGLAYWQSNWGTPGAENDCSR